MGNPTDMWHILNHFKTDQRFDSPFPREVLRGEGPGEQALSRSRTSSIAMALLARVQREENAQGDQSEGPAIDGERGEPPLLEVFCQEFRTQKGSGT